MRRRQGLNVNNYHGVRCSGFSDLRLALLRSSGTGGS